MALLHFRNGELQDTTGTVYVNFHVTVTYITFQFVLYCVTGQHTVAYKDTRTLQIATIWHSKCEPLLPPTRTSSRCLTCTIHRKSLWSISCRHEKQLQLRSSHMTSSTSHVNYRYLTALQKEERLRELHSKQRNASKQLERLQNKLTGIIAEKGICVDKCMHDDLKRMMEDCANTF